MTIGPFKDDHRWLSNFWEAPITFNGRTYQTNEHLYQSFKTLNLDEVEAIAQADSPYSAKKLGFDSTLRDDWDEIKIPVMMQVSLLKFTQHPELHEKLMETNNEDLIEFNKWHDNYWGICECNSCRGMLGENHLGKTLMMVRNRLRHFYIVPSFIVSQKPSLPESNQKMLF